ncbi:MAG TPA: hypothetical protein VMB03_26950 [Bryobacteraceae bacterium]|nr:hypothetical protein [Bryobacteraceae bacterium]
MEGCAQETCSTEGRDTLDGLPLVEIVITAVWLIAPDVPVMMIQPVMVLAVVKLKFVLVDPLPMVTLAGTIRAGLLLVKTTVETPTLAPASVAVQLPETPGAIVEGLQLRPENDAGNAKEIEVAFEVPFHVAVRTAVEVNEKVPALAVKDPEDEPLETVMGVFGTVSAAFVLDSVIDAVVPAGTGTVRLTVQVVEVCASSALAAQVSEDTPRGAARAMAAVAVEPFKVPVRVAVWFALSVPVEILNVPEAAPCVSVTDAGAVKAGEALFVSVTAAPPDRAASDRNTVHVALAFEESVVAVQLKLVIVGGGSRDTVAIAAGPFRAAVRVAVWFLVTAPVETVNVAVVAPAVTVTDAGTLKTPDALLVRVTTAPPDSAVLDRVTVQVVLPLEESVETVHANPVTTGGASNDIVAVAVDPFMDAVRVAV